MQDKKTGRISLTWTFPYLIDCIIKLVWYYEILVIVKINELIYKSKIFLNSEKPNS